MPAQDNSKTSSTPALEALRLFRVIFKSASRHFHDIEKTVGIGGASLWALVEIAESNELTVSGLAKAMSIHQSTASNLMEKMESSGYVIRTRSANDRRVVHLSLTDQGREIIAKAPQPYRGILPDALMRLDPDVLNALNRHLNELISGMERKVETGAYEPLGKS